MVKNHEDTYRLNIYHFGLFYILQKLWGNLAFMVSILDPPINQSINVFPLLHKCHYAVDQHNSGSRGVFTYISNYAWPIYSYILTMKYLTVFRNYGLYICNIYFPVQ